MASCNVQSTSERSGVFRGEDGHLYLPGTRRPDGSYRKPIRVKEGYIPQEEQPVYETKGVKWQKDKPVCPGLHIEEPSTAASSSKNAERNRKKREARQKETQNTATYHKAAGVEQISETLEATKINNDAPQQQVDAAKRLKNLRKRLAQIDALKAKMDSGELSKPDPDQVKKVERRDEVVQEIASLEKL